MMNAILVEREVPVLMVSKPPRPHFGDHLCSVGNRLSPPCLALLDHPIGPGCPHGPLRIYLRAKGGTQRPHLVQAARGRGGLKLVLATNSGVSTLTGVAPQRHVVVPGVGRSLSAAIVQLAAVEKPCTPHNRELPSFLGLVNITHRQGDHVVV